MGLGLLTALAIGRDASAAVDPLEVQGLELASGHLMDRPPVMTWGQAGHVVHPGLDRMRHEVGQVWVDWDPARGHAGGIITTGLPAPGTVADAGRAETFTRAWLSRYLDVLAPGASIDDFVVVSNHYGAGIRTVGLVQLHAGRPVRGGQMSVRFKADRLVYVASQALPAVDVALHTGPALEPAAARAEARAWIGRDFPGATLHAEGFAGPSILPIWTGTGWSYHEVVSVRVNATQPLGQWVVHLDAATGDVVAREQLMRTAGTVNFNVPERHPGSTRSDAFSPELQVTETGQAGTTTGLLGEVNLVNSPTTLSVGVVGPRVDVDNDAGPDAQGSFPITDGGSLTWNDAGNEFVDAQLSAFVHTSRVKTYVRAIDPGLGWLDQQIDVTVNIGGSCNASSNGDDIFFLQGNGSCNNTARLADVVYHEVGHSVHRQALIEGVGAFEGALSEGISDYLAATIVDDSGMGRGFNLDDEPLRELNPDGYEWSWPEDKGGVHFEGQIIGGTLWDLRTALMLSLGAVPGREHTDRIWYEATRRAVNIPTMYPEALVYDDDDGDLSNGTPNICEINAAFEAHGLLDPTLLGDFTVDFSQQFEGGRVTVESSLPMVAGCPVELADATLYWRFRGDAVPGNPLPMTLQDGVYMADIPTQDAGVVVEYQVRMTYSNGEEQLFPRNPADRWYQAYFGATEPIYCLDASADLDQWVSSGSDDFWTFGPLGSAGIDPGQPWDDDGVLLHQEGSYTPNDESYATGPAIDITGYQDVRLHYRRWLTVEDGFYDEASIFVNGQTEWTNATSPQTNIHHLDREWRFHDVPLSDYIAEGEVTLSFGLDSDQGLHFGGWSIDALCVVGVVDEICGDGQVTGEEECDDGNTDDGDGCDATCVVEEIDPPGTTGGEDETGDGEPGDGESGALDDTGGVVTATGGPGDGPGTGDGSGDDGAGQDGGVSDEGCGCAAGSSETPLRGGAWLLVLLAGALRRRRSR